MTRSLGIPLATLLLEVTTLCHNTQLFLYHNIAPVSLSETG